MFLLTICTMVGIRAKERIRRANELALENEATPMSEECQTGPLNGAP